MNFLPLRVSVAAEAGAKPALPPALFPLPASIRRAVFYGRDSSPSLYLSLDLEGPLARLSLYGACRRRRRRPFDFSISHLPPVGRGREERTAQSRWGLRQRSRCLKMSVAFRRLARNPQYRTETCYKGSVKYFLKLSRDFWVYSAATTLSKQAKGTLQNLHDRRGDTLSK